MPVAEFPILKRVVNFIYEGQISFGSQEELDEFSDALILLKVQGVLLTGPPYKYKYIK